MEKEKIYISLNVLKERLTKSYGNKFDKLILFGSVARNEFNNESDVDILIMMNQGKELNSKIRNELIDKVFDLELEYDLSIDLKYFDKSQLNSIWGRTPFMQNVFNDGIVL